MLERVKQALVESYGGALAVGWIFAQGVQHFAFIFVAPIAGWAQRRTYRALTASVAPASFTLQDALPEVARCVALLLVGYWLLRWLYFQPLDTKQVTEPNPEESV